MTSLELLRCNESLREFAETEIRPLNPGTSKGAPSPPLPAGERVAGGRERGSRGGEGRLIDAIGDRSDAWRAAAPTTQASLPESPLPTEIGAASPVTGSSTRGSVFLQASFQRESTANTSILLSRRSGHSHDSTWPSQNEKTARLL